VAELVGLIEPCLPSPAKAPPSGPDWLHEIKHDGFRILARRDANGVRLLHPQRSRAPVSL
jgi:ATP-dependent DNA ligase